MPNLVLGPLLRYTGADDATIWVETDGPCEVEVLGCREPTFRVDGHHYALVHVTGLEPAATIPYEVRLDGARVWPQDLTPYPPSVIRTHDPGTPFRIAWGSCRVSAPHRPPHSLTKDEHPEGREVDALRVLADHMCRGDLDVWPHALVLLGDQVYADEVAPEVVEQIRERRDVTVPPGEQIADFEEYTLLYRNAWSEPHIRWLLSTVPTAMIFDDHDIHDDWNTSRTWVEDMRATGWWDDRIVGGLASYWLYQHMGNLAPDHLAQDDLYRALREAEDGGPLLREYAFRADREVAGTRWSYCRDFGASRLIMIDSRAGRVLDPPEERSMLDPGEWEWFEEHAQGDVRPPADRDVAAAAARAGAALPRGVERGGLQRRLGRARRRARREAAPGRRPRALGGVRDVARAGDGARAPGRERGGQRAGVDRRAVGRRPPRLPRRGRRSRRGATMRSAVYQATCSPFRNPLDDRERRSIRAAWTKPVALFGRALARAAGVGPPPVRWRMAHDSPYFDNQVCFVELDGRRSRLWLQKTVPGEDDGFSLETVFEQRLA